MNWLRASIPFTIPLAVIALLWTVPVQPDPAADAVSSFVGRSIGLGLLALALLAIGFIFYSVRAPEAASREPPAPMALARHEFRRGFGSGRVPLASRRPERAASTVIALAPGASRATSAPRPLAVRSRPQEGIRTLTKRLQERAGTLWRPRAI